MPYTAFRRSWMAENALLAALELRQSLEGKWLSGCAMRLWSGLAEWGHSVSLSGLSGRLAPCLQNLGLLPNNTRDPPERKLNVPDILQTRVAAETEGPVAGEPRPAAPVLSGGSEVVCRLGGDWLYPGLTFDAGQSGTARGIWRETQQHLRLCLLGPGSRWGSGRGRSRNRTDIRRSYDGHYRLA
jgi:hypothetical protein